MAKRKEEKRGPTLFDFIEVKKEEKKETPPQGVDISEELYAFIKSAKRVGKEEVVKWAKTRGVSAGDFYKALEKLLAQRRIRKKLDDEGNLVYEPG
ncbi:hypothetical protein [Pyrobaculum aerophilum]|uniref:Uncharacterized protein n=2 Tax=Pyrobaculum aerophilum TaxID=13773 RepID=Q8ZWU6_PYRAE|nr:MULTISPECIES: hypothetical protein [Pyrobaculum]AAL63603.1 hypothetical protein PAE1614 [Pyrobaculum aerophilum str. IM2]MCX8136484.1 hypothetical protein [Pyrobaculum aerophilum]RFA95674.1 hypothetical protein CGL51_07225 [Pyrobaculum aerophilum]RFB00211.1 hypothetical protein CGL52_01065 [Pyrobaculum aerophilum]HII46474.1 hypothetical protein [Pyrobaculum aerophilum]